MSGTTSTELQVYPGVVFVFLTVESMHREVTKWTRIQEYYRFSDEGIQLFRELVDLVIWNPTHLWEIDWAGRMV